VPPGTTAVEAALQDVAGLASEMLCGADPVLADIHFNGDRGLLIRLLEGEPTADDLIESVMGAALGILWRRRSALLRVAYELVAEREMSGRQLRRLLTARQRITRARSSKRRQ
jgi:hypothetical protein